MILHLTVYFFSPLDHVYTHEVIPLIFKNQEENHFTSIAPPAMI